MTTLTYTPISNLEHAGQIQVEFRHSDLPNAFARIFLLIPVDQDGECLTGEAWRAAILAQAPSRAWFEAQEDRLTGTAAVKTLPEEFRAVAPIIAPERFAEWYEDASVGAPEFVGGRWVRKTITVDLRSEANLPMLKDRLIAKLAGVRYRHEVGGVNIGGALVKTDRESQATITGAYARATTEPATTIEWKVDNGFVTLDADSIIMFGGAVFEHVQGCFAREKELVEQVSASSGVTELMSLADTIETGWGA